MSLKDKWPCSSCGLSDTYTGHWPSSSTNCSQSQQFTQICTAMSVLDNAAKLNRQPQCHITVQCVIQRCCCQYCCPARRFGRLYCLYIQLTAVQEFVDTENEVIRFRRNVRYNIPTDTASHRKRKQILDVTNFWVFWFCVGVLVMCVLVFTCFILLVLSLCIVLYVYLFLFVLSALI